MALTRQETCVIVVRKETDSVRIGDMRMKRSSLLSLFRGRCGGGKVPQEGKVGGVTDDEVTKLQA